MENRVEIILRQKGLTKSEFAVKMGTSKQNVNGLLKNPTQNKLAEIAKALDVPLWELFAKPEDVAAQMAGGSEAVLSCPYCHKLVKVALEPIQSQQATDGLQHQD